jgi:hypothetical protein
LALVKFNQPPRQAEWVIVETSGPLAIVRALSPVPSKP